MISKLIGGIVFAIVGIVITLVNAFAIKDIAIGVVGGLFIGAGATWIANEILSNKLK